MVDIQSVAAEIRRGKKEDRNHRAKILWPALYHRVAIINLHTKYEYPFFTHLAILDVLKLHPFWGKFVRFRKYKLRAKNRLIH